MSKALALGAEVSRASVAALNDLTRKQFRELLLSEISALIEGGAQRSFLGDILATHCRAAEVGDVEAVCASLGLAKPAAADVATAVAARKAEIQHGVTLTLPRFPAISSLRWRVDVHISSSSVSRVMRPTVLLELGLSSGQVHTLEASLEAFQGLRYVVAKALAEMGHLDAHPALKIT